MKQLVSIFLLCLVAAAFIGGCTRNQHTDEPLPSHDLPQIEDSGELVALTLYSSTTYFIYRGESMGFQYELAEQFARSLGVKLKIEIADNPQKLQQMLLQGKGDIIVYNLPITLEGRDSLLYCGDGESPSVGSTWRTTQQPLERCHPTDW